MSYAISLEIAVRISWVSGNKKGKPVQENISMQHSGPSLCSQRLDIKIPMSPASDADDEDEAADLKDTPRSNPGIPKFLLCKMSTYVYAAAINDSKPMVDKDNVELRSR
jgi:hypothetical protein